MSILIIAEHDGEKLNSATLSAITAAEKLSDKELDIVIMGYQCLNIAEQAAKNNNISKVLLADNSIYKNITAENAAELISDIGKDYSYVIAGATNFTKNIIPRISALLDVQMISEISEVISDDIFARPIYARNAIATVQLQEKIKVLTVRPSSFIYNDTPTSANSAQIIELENIKDTQLSSFIEKQTIKSERPNLSSASIVVAGGKSLGTVEKFDELVIGLADKLNAAIGATRDAVNAGFAPNECQIGHSGKSISPNLYIAIGISGASQHISGIKDSKVIVAINKDPEAPIFEVADYGLVEDLFTAVPKFKELI